MNPGYNFQTITNPKAPTLATTYDTSVDTSTEVTLNSGTTFIEVSTITAGIFLRWGTSDASSSAFDEYISPNQTRLYAVPSGTTAVNFIQSAANAVLIVIEK